MTGSSELQIALAIPAFNEADGIGSFLSDLDAVLADAVAGHTFVVVDDRSTDQTAAVLKRAAPDLTGELVVVSSAHNRGHGPTVVRAYHAALDRGPDAVLQVDGDGQFEVEDIRLLLGAWDRGNVAVTGRRVRRVDPWYRRGLSASLRGLLLLGFGVRRRDINCPFRLYDAATLAALLDGLPAEPLVPHVLLTILEGRSELAHAEVDVRHRDRRGDTTTGSTWRGRRTLTPVPWPLVRFSALALVEVIRFGLRLGRRGATKR